MPSNEFLSSKLKEMRTRLEQLKPSYEEYLEIDRALRAVESAVGAVSGKISDLVDAGRGAVGLARSKPSKPAARKSAPKRTTTTAKKRSPRRSRTGGTRADEAVKIVTQNPGVSVSEIAKQMGIRQNYLYRVLNKLESDGRVKKSGRGYVAAA